MRATELARTRIVYSETSFAEIVVWQLPRPLPGSTHSYKYRLAYVVDGACVLRYDNESGKGDHRHVGGVERRYRFTDPVTLVAAFEADIRMWNDENSDA